MQLIYKNGFRCFRVIKYWSCALRTTPQTLLQSWGVYSVSLIWVRTCICIKCQPVPHHPHYMSRSSSTKQIPNKNNNITISKIINYKSSYVIFDLHYAFSRQGNWRKTNWRNLILRHRKGCMLLNTNWGSNPWWPKPEQCWITSIGPTQRS